ncbi:BH4019 [Halalkalibacterium halodurans C-125]|uniref:BH4019 protein n=2 Tax=Halalkalibacterium halodurans TaxID=86665 RepID=Q9K5R9_HALH5|nr:hypothetical protein [Halalkalibacterium halodurans]BAB07738.1 BH4019 [Halalkalibacterium halodurans C-125]
MSKWKIILGLVVMLSIGTFVVITMTKDGVDKIEKAVGSVHGKYTSIELIHIAKVADNRVIAFHEVNQEGRKLMVAELKKNLLGWNFEKGFSVSAREERRYSVLGEYAVMVGRMPYFDDFHEVKIETANGDVHTATIIESEKGNRYNYRGYWFYIASKEESEEIFSASVYIVTEDGEVVEEIEKPDNEPLY